MKEVTLYSTGCPRCKMLTMQLNNKKVEYNLVDDQGEIASRGIQTIPVLEVDGRLMKFPEALNWVNNYRAEA